jgi:hypothetical protein
MKKQSAFEAWKMLILSLPKGIAAFVIAVAGLSVSLPLSVFLIGLPLLAAVLILCRRMLDSEKGLVDAWLKGERPADNEGRTADSTAASSGWKGLLSVFGSGRAYRSLFYSISQLPVGIASFTIAVVLPVTAFGVMLSPLAYWVSDRFFQFDLFQNGWSVNELFPQLTVTSYQLSWIYGGVGALLVLLLPIVLRTLGRFYAVWIQGIAGPEPQHVVQQAAGSEHAHAAYELNEQLDHRLVADLYKA